MHSHREPVHLTLTFTVLGASAAVRWESPVLGVRYSRFANPYHGAALPLVARALDLAQSLGSVQEAFTPEEQEHLAALGLWQGAGQIGPDACRLVGRALYQALTDDPDGANAFGTVRDYATIQNQPLALHLRLPPAAVELAALPWELLWDDGPIPLLLSRGRVAACTRYLELRQALPAPRTQGGPLRVLALAPGAGIPHEVRQEERQARQAVWQPLLASGHMVMDEISPVSRAALVDALQTRPLPDIIHYYGHGRYVDGEGALLLDDETPGGEGCWTGASALMALLGGVRMVVLFACQGAMVAQPSGLLTGVAPALSAAGIPMVMGMQFSVRVRAATRASGVMYRALAAGWSVQEAVGLVRQALYVEEHDRTSWYVPVLYIRAHTPAPVYLALSPEQSAAAAQIQRLTPAGDAPGVRQVVMARQNSRISAVRMQGGNGSSQIVNAADRGLVGQVRLQARQAGQQAIAAEASEISDIELEA